MDGSRWSALANAQPAPQLLLRFLSTRDVVCWFVSALEAADTTAEQLLTQLRPRLEHDALALHCAAAHGCLRAVWRLRRNIRHQRVRRSPPPHAADDPDEEQAALMRWTDTFRPLALPPGVILAAAARGDLRVVRWLHATSRYEPLRVMRSAAQRGHLEVVEWLATNFATARRRTRRSDTLVVDVQLRLSESTGLAVAWSVARKAEPDASAHAGHREGLHESARRHRFTRFLATRKGFAAPVDTNDPGQLLYDAPRYAAATGDLELLRVLFATRDKREWRFSTRVLAAALGAGHVDAADWLTRHAGVAVTARFDMKSVVIGAIRKDQLRVLQWCRAADRAYFERYFALATMMLCSHLDILRWSYELSPSSPWSPDVLLRMAKNGLWDSVKWVYAAFPRMSAAPGLLDAAAAAGDLEAFALARDRLPASVGVATAITERTLVLACESGTLALVQAIVSEHGVWSPFGASQAALAGHVAVVQWMLSVPSDSGRASFVPKTLASACARSGHYACAAWLLSRLPRSFEQAFPGRGRFEAGEHFHARDASPSPSAWCVRSRALPWRRRFVELVLQHRPEIVMDAYFVGPWAARNGLSDVIVRLIALEYPFVFTKLNLRHILKTTEAGWLVRAFLERHPEWLDLCIIRWAAKFRQLSVLTLLAVSDRGFPASVLRFAPHMVIATARDHEDVVQWLLAAGLADQRTHRRALQAAIRSDSARVLAALQRADFLESDSMDARDVCRAMSRGSVRVVKWILARAPEVLGKHMPATVVDRFVSNHARILEL
ncbi:hypothetical protein PybrP1_010493 [[Pythium] brassicae (nom. inval.)]|nr:hypothetical protein PybrP1_010493 [[Pythium] brassicae (nom. inval.)]